MSVSIENLENCPLAEGELFAIGVSEGFDITVNGESRGSLTSVKRGDSIAISANSTGGAGFLLVKCQPSVYEALAEPIRKPKQKPYVDYRKPYFQR